MVANHLLLKMVLLLLTNSMHGVSGGEGGGAGAAEASLLSRAAATHRGIAATVNGRAAAEDAADAHH